MLKRIVTIESPQGNISSAQVDADLVDKFVNAATDKAGLFRGKKETFQHALDSAVTGALTKFTEK